MDEIYCSLCGVELKDQDAAYGLTPGIIEESCDGFCIDSDSDWDIYCPDCMNEIDKVLVNLKRTRSSGLGRD